MSGWLHQLRRSAFVQYRGPAWLVGYSSYPICGLLGLLSIGTYVTGLSAWMATKDKELHTHARPALIQRQGDIPAPISH